MAEGYRFGLMALDMMAFGWMISFMEGVGLYTAMEQCIMVNGKLENLMVMESSNFLTEANMKANGLMIYNMERGLKFLQMGPDMKVNILMAKNKAKACKHGLMEVHIKVNSRTISCMVMVTIYGKMADNLKAIMKMVL